MLYFIIRLLCSKKFQILLIVLMNFRDWVDYMVRIEVDDLSIAHLLGKSVVTNCRHILANLDNDESNIQNIISHFVSRVGRHRKIQIFRSKTTGDKIIGKSYAKSYKIIRALSFPLNSEYLRREYLTQVAGADLQICPHDSIQQFVNFFTTNSEYNETTVWLLMLTNPQLLVHPYLEHHGFPVPQLFGVCGLTTFQEHVGQTLQHFYKANFEIKLRIAKQLLESALKFTNGFEGYRMYITDLTADNLIYNEERDKLYFIDLNTAFIVDSKYTIHKDDIDQHENIECDDCFAFVPDRLCTYGISDVNLLESCLFLRENWKRDRTKGFLKPIPAEITAKYPNLETLLDSCVDGVVKTETESVEEMSRFLTTLKLIELFSDILNEF